MALKLYRPSQGRRALMPNGEPLPDGGAAIALTPYWRRLLAAGDIEPVPTSKPKPRTSGKGSKSA
jgi:hypothetical protein